MTDTLHPPALDLPAVLCAPLGEALDLIEVPTVVLDRECTVHWANHAAMRLVGSRVGSSFVSFLAPESRSSFRTALARTTLGGDAGVADVTLIGVDAEHVNLHLRSAPLRSRDGEITGALALVVPADCAPRVRAAGGGAMPLTPRQADVLRLLGDGLTTEAIAHHLGVAVETARNHIRAVLRRLGVHSRLEAVVEARRRGLLGD
jgi:DNA-binding CsgD family transcriptional regulator